MPTKELIARCTDCGVLFQGNLTYDLEERPLLFDYKSPLVQLIGAHHLKFLRAAGHGNVILFTRLEDAIQKPLEESENTKTAFDRYPTMIGTLTVARTSSTDVFNTAGSLLVKFIK